MQTVYEVVGAAADRCPDNGMVCAPPMAGRAYHADGIEITYAEAWREIEALREAYAAAGWGHGHRMALLLEQRPEFFFHFLALNALGCAIVPISPDYRHEELQYLLGHSEAHTALAIESRIAELQHAAPISVVSFENFTVPEAPCPPPLSGAPKRESECALLYTSGTTGRPKGCILTNGYYLNAGAWYVALGGRATLREGDRLINPLPLFHMNSQAVSATAMFLVGGCLILPDRFHPKSWWRDVVATQATVIHYLGVVPPLLMNLPPAPEDTAHQVRFGIGAGIEPELHGPFETRFGFPLIEVWGMTETGRIYADCHEPRQIDTRAFGKPLPGLEARVVDDEGNDAEQGELLVRHTAEAPRKDFFAGYLKNEEATEEVWHGGWFHTGDTVRQGDDGMLYFVDRKKNIIRRSGENIAAAEVEACLQTHDAVAQVAVVAVPDALRDEEVMACIVPISGIAAEEALAQRLFAWCDTRLAYYKAPGWITFRDSLPTTGTQKVQKTQLFDEGDTPTAGAIDLRPRKRKKR